MVKDNKKLKSKHIVIGIFVIGIVLRFIAYLLADPSVNQHDVLLRYGHFDYAVYMFKYWRLAPTWNYEFAQPPVNAIMQAIVMSIIDFFKYHGDDYLSLYTHTKILSLIYSVLTFYIVYKILYEFDISDKIKNVILFVFAIYPQNIIMTTQYSNDGISYLFFYLSIFICLRWIKNKKLSTIILLALTIGIGMLTKISVGLVAFLIGPMMLAVLISNIISEKDISTKNLILQYVVFALIVFPIGLSYSVRNLVLFGVRFGEIYEIAVGTDLDMRKYSYTFIDRFLSFPLNRVFNNEYGIYHDMAEYNIWIDFLKTATFDEYNYGKTIAYPLLVLLYVVNIIFHMFGLFTIVYNLISSLKYILNKFISKVKNLDLSKSYCHLENLRIISVILYIIAICSYVGFNYKYQYSCNSNYRYIQYITFAVATSIVLFISDKNKNLIKND